MTSDKRGALEQKAYYALMLPFRRKGTVYRRAQMLYQVHSPYNMERWYHDNIHSVLSGACSILATLPDGDDHHVVSNSRFV